MVEAIYKGNTEVNALYKGVALLHKTKNVPTIVTPYSGFPEVVTDKDNTVFNGYYAQKRNDFIILASELVALGMKQGTSILGMAFKNKSVTPAVTTIDFRLALKHTTQSTAPDVFDSYFTFQEVFYSHELSAFTENTYHMIDFTSPFIWDGSSNILVSTSQDRPEWTSSDNTLSVFREDVGGTNYLQTIFYDDGAEFPFEASSTSDRVSSIPSIQLNVLGLGVQKAQLSAFMVKSEAVLADKASYSIASVGLLETAYNEATLLFNSSSVSQSDIDKAVARFNAIYSGLVSFVEVNNLIADVLLDNPEYMYTTESYTALQTAITAAQESMEIADISQEAINEHISVIQTAASNLTFVPFAGGKLTTVPTEVVSEGLLGYWDVGGYTNEEDDITELMDISDISENHWDMYLLGLNGTKTSGFANGYGLNLDGVDDMLQTIDMRPFNSKEVTIELVFSRSEWESYMYTLFADEFDNRPDNGLTFYNYNSSGTFPNFYFKYFLDTKSYSNDVSNISDKSKNKIHLTYTASVIGESVMFKVYINGVIFGQKSMTVDFDTFDFTGYFVPMGYDYGHVAGTFHSAKVYEKALTEEEISQNYNHEKTRWGLE